MLLFAAVRRPLMKRGLLWLVVLAAHLAGVLDSCLRWTRVGDAQGNGRTECLIVCPIPVQLFHEPGGVLPWCWIRVPVADRKFARVFPLAPGTAEPKNLQRHGNNTKQPLDSEEIDFLMGKFLGTDDKQSSLCCTWC